MGGPILRRLPQWQRDWERIPELVERHAAEFAAGSEKDLQQVAWQLRRELREHGFEDSVVARSFALVRETATRVLSMRHYDVQLMGGWLLLQGMVAEMQTGEGKTIAATLPACTAAFAGVPVHIVTVNDYLAQRDAENMGPLYANTVGRLSRIQCGGSDAGFVRTFPHHS